MHLLAAHSISLSRLKAPLSRYQLARALKVPLQPILSAGSVYARSWYICGTGTQPSRNMLQVFLLALLLEPVPLRVSLDMPLVCPSSIDIWTVL